MQRKRTVPFYVFTVFTSILVLILLFQLLMKTLLLPPSISEPNQELKDYHVVLISEEVDNDYWRLMEQGARELEKSTKLLVEYRGPQRSNLDEQMKIMDMAIAAQVDGIVVQALNEDEFTPLIDKAVNKGIPVITIDADAPKSKRSAYVGTDNYLSGWEAGKALAQDTNGQAVVGIITGSLTSSHMQQRVQGFKDATATYKGISIVAIEESNITRIEAEEKTNKILTEYEEITAFFGTSALDGLGIQAAIERFGKKDDIYIIAFDVLPQTIELLQAGEIHAVVAQEPFEMGKRGMELVLDVLQGKTVVEINYTRTNIIRKSDIQQELNGESR
ncbi:sugar-binding protein [Halalkalibacter urbisdiaboli]|uniref:sugar-binding protein n=1 Tax=Halalkalibacter urbisdiaboli TaxID=1960589 RepID=UPI000B42D17D|nr:sugar-binding protein [Halalkalibacter urbisdiaboli]